MARRATHFFDSSSEAYDACMCSPKVKRGDIIIVPSEKVVGVSDTWPVAITPETGELHSKADDWSWEKLFSDADVGFTQKDVWAAEEAAEALGFKKRIP